MPDIQVFLEPLENAISDLLIPAISDCVCNENDRSIISLRTRDGGLGITNPCNKACLEFSLSVTETAPLVDNISQSHALPGENKMKTAKQRACAERDQAAKEKFRNVKDNLPKETSRAAEKGASTWLNVFPLKDLGFNLNKREFRDAFRLR